VSRWLLMCLYWPQRMLDLRILWPICKKSAEERGLDIDYAKAAFAYHAFRDGAWTCLGEREIERRIDELE
jgi:hypothetical protein